MKITKVITATNHAFFAYWKADDLLLYRSSGAGGYINKGWSLYTAYAGSSQSYGCNSTGMWFSTNTLDSFLLRYDITINCTDYKKLIVKDKACSIADLGGRCKYGMTVNQGNSFLSLTSYSDNVRTYDISSLSGVKTLSMYAYAFNGAYNAVQLAWQIDSVVLAN